jgi:hypothetical protein
MTSQRAIKYFEQIKENFKNFGYPTPFLNVQGLSTDTAFFPNCQVVEFDFDALTWVAGNRKIVFLQVPAGFGESDSVKTQSHAAGTFIDGSYKWIMLFEAQAALTNASGATRLAFDKFVADALHIVRGQHQAPVDVYFCNNTEEPKVQGVNGAVASSTHLTKIASLLPYGRTYPGGI